LLAPFVHFLSLAKSCLDFVCIGWAKWAIL